MSILLFLLIFIFIMFDLEKIARENIRRLTPYSSARSEYGGAAARIFLDANENAFGSPIERDYSRYPDPLQTEIKNIIAERNGVAPDEIFVGNGSDEAIDLLFRVFCEPKRDNVLICPPTYGMYAVSAEINAVEIKRVNLTANFELDFDAVKEAIDENTRLVFVCSPNNPTGNSFDEFDILKLAENFDGIIVVDEAYIHFSPRESLIAEVKNHPNLVVLQTFSKAWGLAGLRVGVAFADRKIIELLSRVKPPYNVSEIAQAAILRALENQSVVDETVGEIIKEREKLIENLSGFSFVKKVYPSDANFILVKTTDADAVYKFLIGEKIVVRNRNNVELCAGCLRITVGTPRENAELLKGLGRFTTETQRTQRFFK